MDKRVKWCLTAALSLILMLTMVFSVAGIAGMFGTPGMVALGSDGAAVEKAENTMTVKAKKVTVKYSKLKKEKQTISKKKAFTVEDAVGEVTFTKKSGNKKITVSSSGKVTVKKKLKKGSYKVKVKVKAAGDENYKSKSKTVTLTVKVK